MLSMRLLPYLLVLARAVPDTHLAQGGRAELLLPGSEYHRVELPADAAGAWWVLHRPRGTPTLEALPIAVTPAPGCGGELSDEPSGLEVMVPQAKEPILMVRGLPGLTAGAVRTAFIDRDGEGEAEAVRTRWGEQSLEVRHVTDPPAGDQPGRYRIELILGDMYLRLHSDAWHGDGHWRVRWIGDLNRDGWPDLLLDASYKYSIHTTRLFLSGQRDGRFDLIEAVTLEHTAC